MTEILTEIWTDLKEFFEDLLIKAVNILIEFLSKLVELAATLLPDWEPLSVPSFLDTYNVMPVLNWVFPVDYAVTMIEVYLFSTIAYFTIGTITRWAKITGG